MNFDLKSLFKSKKSPPAEDTKQAKGLPPQLESALIWAKANLLLVMLAIVSVGALGAGWWYQGEFQSAIDEEAATYAGKAAELARLQSSEVTITIPGSAPVTVNTVVTAKLVDAVKQRMGVGGSDAVAIRRNAVAHNKGSHEPVVNLRLAPKDPKRQEVHLDFFKALNERYAELLAEVNAGSPPSEEDVVIKLQRRQVRFVQSNLKKAGDAALTSEERGQLQPELVSYRLALYNEVAQTRGMYCDAESIGLPSEPPAKGDLLRLWRLQWELWIAQDIVRACEMVNVDAAIQTAPIKRLARIQFVGPVLARGESSPSGEGGEPAPEGGEAGAADDSLATAPPIDPGAPVNMSQFATSAKGWASNQLFDVFTTRVNLFVETTKIPQIANAFSKQNFIVVTDVKIRPVDPFATAAEGFVYGNDAVSELTLTLESAWLREWTGPLMPDEVRAQLNTSGMLAGSEPSSTPDSTKEN